MVEVIFSVSGLVFLMNKASHLGDFSCLEMASMEVDTREVSSS